MVAQSKCAPAPASYSTRQIALHWIVFLLAAFQFMTGDHMTHLFRAAHGGNPADASSVWTPIHISVGLLILVLMLARLALRRFDRVPPPPRQAPALEWLAGSVHAGLYIDLIGAPVVGLIAFFGCPGSPDCTSSWPARSLSFFSRSISPARYGIGWSSATA
jgi:cytochrome b561